jgi:hypothetical protein
MNMRKNQDADGCRSLERNTRSASSAETQARFHQSVLVSDGQGQTDSDANFQLWNPGVALPHVAEAPIYMSSGGFTSMIHVCNASPNSATVELAVRNQYGTALAAPPVQFTLTSGQVRAINAASYLFNGDANVSMGSIRLRHNGSTDSDVRAILAVEHNNEDDSFTVPFVYAASSQSPSSGMQCSPLYYVDGYTSALLSLQNVTNLPVSVSVILHYGTGAPGTPNGIYNLPAFTLAPQQTQITDLANYASQLQGTNWGSVTLNAPSQTVVAHMVMMSHSNELAFNSRFVDPAMFGNTTKVASTLKLDYDMDMQACVMVCNMSQDSRTVTANFKTNNGVTLPSSQLTLGPGQQQMIELDSAALLGGSGTSTMANVSLSYNGNASDIIAGAVSMSAANHCAIPAEFVEMHPTDGRHLVAPFFKFDERTSGFLQISNFGSTDIKAGVIMKFADTTLPMLNTNLITVPAGGTSTVDIQSYFGRVDDTVTAEGCVEVIHNGVSGSVAATFTALGKYNNLSMEVPLEAGPAFASNAMQIFPNNVELGQGDGTGFSAMTGESLQQPAWSVSATSGNPGTISSTGSSASYVYDASYVSTTDPSTFAVTLQADATSSGGPIQTGSITLDKVLISGFDTSLGFGRMRPDTPTSFTITGDRDWPDGPLTVRFKGSGGLTDIENLSKSPSDPRILPGMTPSIIPFIGDAQVIVLQNGIKISKDKTGTAYFAFDPPTSVASVSPDGFNRLGGILAINGGGFRTFGTILPEVNIDGVGFTTSSVNGQSTQITGLVLRATNDVRSCTVEGQIPCKSITVKNPGHRNRDKTTSSIPLYNLKPGPPPVAQSRFPDFGPSIGVTQMVILGQDLGFSDSVTFGGTPALIDSQSDRKLVVTAPPHLAGNVAVLINDVDLESITVPGGYVYKPTAPIKVAGTVITDGTFIVGPAEAVIDAGNHSFSGGGSIWVRSFDVTINHLTNLPPGVTSPIEAYTADVTSFTISANTPPGKYTITCTYKIGNSAAPNDQSLWRPVTQDRSFTVE